MTDIHSLPKRREKQNTVYQKTHSFIKNHHDEGRRGGWYGQHLTTRISDKPHFLWQERTQCPGACVNGNSHGPRVSGTARLNVEWISWTTYPDPFLLFLIIIILNIYRVLFQSLPRSHTPFIQFSTFLSQCRERSYRVFLSPFTPISL